MKKHASLLLVTGFILCFVKNIAGQLGPTVTKSVVIPQSVNRDALKNNFLVKPVPNGVFSTKFSNTATGRNDINAYLLCYLSTLVYPQYLGIHANNTAKSYEDKLHTDPIAFESEYKKYTEGLFTAPEFKFFRRSDRLGYDPEAMVINTASTLFIVFRGTDRVGSNKSGFLYTWAEWISTDFDARQITDPDLPGKIISGMWESLKYEGFKEELLNYLNSKGAKNKKVWITGHSLGAGQAQLFAMYLAKKGIVAQGVYVYAAPHPGDKDFVRAIDATFPNNRLQRFDFLTDPITTLAPYIMGFERSGTRVYYNDISSIAFNANERSEVEVASVFPGLVNAIKNSVYDYVNETSGKRLKLDNLLGGSTMCYHHPLWYLEAAYRQLGSRERGGIPRPLPLPGSETEGCDLATVERGKTANLLQVGNNIVRGRLDEAATAIGNGIASISFAATTIINNVTGMAITPGDYYINLYSSGRLYLNEQEGYNNGSNLYLTSTRNKVRIERSGTVGYTIQFGTRTVTNDFFGVKSAEVKRYVLDSETESLYQDGASEIQLWEKNNVPGFNMNQRWLFIQVPGHPGKFIIKNMANGKVLDADNDCVNGASCRIKTYKPITNDQTQIWVLEQAR
jgi:hypothetical protein